MKKIVYTAALILCVCVSGARAATRAETGLFAYETATGMTVGAVFGDLPVLPTDDRLLSATSPVCDHVEIHSMTETNGIMRMRKVQNLDMPAKSTMALSPQGYHVMLIGLKSPLRDGSVFPLTLTFQSAGTMTLSVPVHSRIAK